VSCHYEEALKQAYGDAWKKSCKKERLLQAITEGPFNSDILAPLKC
jgi:hypothetical protein